MKSENNTCIKFEHTWLSDTIIYFKYSDNALVELSDVQKMLQLQRELGVDENVKRIVYAGRYTTITPEAREYVQRNKPKVKAEAFVLSGLAQKILFDFYHHICKNENPIKSFNNLEDAFKWIEHF